MIETDNQDKFKFKQFEILQEKSSMKVNTDAIMLGSWSKVSDPKNALDIGTGTGVIALIIAQRYPKIEVKAIDIDLDSSIEASQNIANSPYYANVSAQHISIQDLVGQTNEKYDLIISNPPFFSGGTFSHNENKNNVRHTVKLSHSDLLTSVKKLLSPNGQFDLILPYIEGLRFIELALQYDLYLQRQTDVISKYGKPIERLLLSFSNNKEETATKTSLVIYDENKANSYTNEFIEMTKDFYNFM